MFIISFNRALSIFVVGIVLTSCANFETQNREQEAGAEFRAPAYPLITVDPYTSAWSTSNQLFDSPVKHWSGRNHSMIGAVRVDGKTYRFLGKEEIPLQPVLSNAKHEAWEAKYVPNEPAKGWETPGFNDASWKSGKAGFGTPNTFETNTPWQAKEIWVRREFNLNGSSPEGKLYLNYSHDDDFELYINGTPVVNTGNRAKSNVTVELDRKVLKKGKNLIAAHCLDRGGLAYVDFGIFKDSDQTPLFAQAAVQKSVKLTATQTKYDFTCGPVDLHLEFASPLLMDDLDLLSRPVNYVSYEVVSNDGQPHQVEVYVEATPEWAVNELSQEVQVVTGETGGIKFAKQERQNNLF